MKEMYSRSQFAAFANTFWDSVRLRCIFKVERAVINNTYTIIFQCNRNLFSRNFYFWK